MERDNDEQPRKGPFGRIYGPWIKDLPHMGHNEWRILFMLLEQLEFDEHGNATAWQPRAVMAESLGLSERQVSDAVRRLREKGVLSVKRPGCNGHATVYNVMPGKPWPAEPDAVAVASDQERREVADQLRHEAAYREDSTLGEWWACLQSVACGCDDFPDPRTLFDRLADLIDPADGTARTTND